MGVGTMAGGRLLGVALSPLPTSFGPLLFPGRLEEGLEAVAGNGFSAVELSVHDAGHVDAQRLSALLEQHGLAVSAIATGQACVCDGLCLDAADPAVRQGAAARLAGAVELAADLGASVIVGGIRGRFDVPQAERADRRRDVLDALGQSTRRATRLGVTQVLEPINRYETGLVHTAAEALEVLEEIDEPSMGVLLDTFHMNIEERSLPDAIRAVGDRLAYVHVADSNRLAPGHGHIDFPGVARTLEEIGYQGPVVAEILPLPDDRTAAVDAWAYLYPLFGSSSTSQGAVDRRKGGPGG